MKRINLNVLYDVLMVPENAYTSPNHNCIFQGTYKEDYKPEKYYEKIDKEIDSKIKYFCYLISID